MKFNIFILAGVFLALFLPLCLAESFGNGIKGIAFDFVLPCSNGTNVCTYCNITSITSQANSTPLVSNVVMSLRTSEFNYTLQANYTSMIGNYKISGICGDGGQIITWNYDWKITPNGSELSVPQGILYLVFLIAAIGIFLLCLYYAVKIPWKHRRDEEGYIIGVNDLRYFKLFLIVICYIVLMFSAGLLRGITANYIPEIGVSGFFEWIFWIMLSLMYPIIICAFIIALIIFLTNRKLYEGIKRGLPLE